MSSEQAHVLPYDGGYYAGWQPTVRMSAAAVVPHLLTLFSPRSVVDVGCGGGAWAAEFVARGVEDVVGVDGEYVDRSVLAIPDTHFVPCDITSDFAALIGRRFDVALCLEVAEHLPAAAGDTLVQRLAALADLVVFSAAVPGQGGRNHRNEQWPSYWHDRFGALGMVPLDVVRPFAWTRSDVAVWYRQNTFVYARSPREHGFGDVPSVPADIVHPELWDRARRNLASLREPKTIRGCVAELRGAIGRSLHQRLRVSRPGRDER